MSEKKQFDYENIKDEYADSLSQYDFSLVFNNPDHGALNFAEIKDEFINFFELVFGLEEFNYRENLYQQETNQVDSIRNQLQSHFNQIQAFKIDQGDAPNVRQNLISQIRAFIVQNSKILEDLIIKLKTKNFFDSTEGKAAFASVQKEKKQIEAEKVKIQKITAEFGKLKADFEKDVKNTQSLKLAKSERGIGETEVAKFFSNQANEHCENAVHKQNGWLVERRKFEKYIYYLLGISGVLFLASFAVSIIIAVLYPQYSFKEMVGVWRSFWDFRSGLFITAFLAIFYTGLFFATKNYEKEKNLEYQNRNKSTIAKSVGLFSSGSTELIRERIYEIASKTIFASHLKYVKKDSQNTDISLSASVPDVLNNVKTANGN